MPELLIVGDVHGLADRLDLLFDEVSERRFDLAVQAGDVALDPPWPPLRRVMRGRHDESMREVLGRFRRRLGCPVVYVPGNHDLADAVEVSGAVNADRAVVEAAGLRIAGFGGAGPTSFGFPYEWTEDAAEAALAELARQPSGRLDLFLSHTPPAGCTLDRTARGDHVGSRAVDRWLRRLRPRLFVCGHIHEAVGVERIDDVPCINAGSLGEPHGRDVVWTIDWNDGPTRVESLSRHATKGLVRRWWRADQLPCG